MLDSIHILLHSLLCLCHAISPSFKLGRHGTFPLSTMATVSSELKRCQLLLFFSVTAAVVITKLLMSLLWLLSSLHWDISPNSRNSGLGWEMTWWEEHGVCSRLRFVMSWACCLIHLTLYCFARIIEIMLTFYSWTKSILCMITNIKRNKTEQNVIEGVIVLALRVVWWNVYKHMCA